MIITYKQLAFLLDIEAVHAYEKIIFAYCLENKKAPPPQKTITKESPKPYTVTDYKRMNYPQEIALDILERHTKLTLAPAIRDIQENYLNRAASKKWILCDFPEKEMILKPKNKIKIPSALASMLPEQTIETIKSEWNKRYGIV